MEEKREAGRAAVNVWDCGSPLYDSYEIASLGHVIDRHSLALPTPFGSRKEGRHVIQYYSSMPRDQEKGLEVKQEGALFKIIRVFSWKRTTIKERSDKGIYKTWWWILLFMHPCWIIVYEKSCKCEENNVRLNDLTRKSLVYPWRAGRLICNFSSHLSFFAYRKEKRRTNSYWWWSAISFYFIPPQYFIQI